MLLLMLMLMLTRDGICEFRDKSQKFSRQNEFAAGDGDVQRGAAVSEFQGVAG